MALYKSSLIKASRFHFHVTPRNIILATKETQPTRRELGGAGHESAFCRSNSIPFKKIKSMFKGNVKNKK
jgi:hypothetical protein